MSNRLTPAWTKHVRDAYGSSGEKGFNGEKWLADILMEKGYNVSLHEDDKQLQMQGIDITVTREDLTKPVTVDVKANIKEDGTFFIEVLENGWLFNPKKTSNLIWHVNPTTGWTVRYGRRSMIQALGNLKPRNGLLSLNVNSVADKFNFVKVTKENA